MHGTGTTRRVRFAAGLLLAGLALLLTVAFVSRVWQVSALLSRVLYPSAFAALTLLAAIGCAAPARQLFRRLLLPLAPAASATKPLRAPFWPEVAFLTVTGLPLFGSLCFLVGSLSTSRLPLAGLLAAGVISGVCQLRLIRARATPSAPAPVGAFGFALCAIAFGCAAALAQLPPFALDELAYHLAVPRIWVNEGRVVELPLLSHSYFPFGVESAALPLLANLGERGAIAFHFVVLGATAAGLLLAFDWTRSRAAGSAAILPVAALATTPALVFVAGTGSIDGPFVAIVIAAAAAAGRVLGTGPAAVDGAAVERRTNRLDSYAALGLTIAAGAATKYTFGFVLAAFAFAFALPAAARRVWSRRHPDAQAVRGTEHWPILAFSVLLGLVFGSTFFLRNLLLTGNPLAPFFAPGSPHLSDFNAAQGVLERFLNYLYDPLMADESLGVALLALAAGLGALLVNRPDRSAPAMIGVAMLIAAAALGYSGAAGRLLVPFLAVAAISGTALVRDSTGGRRWPLRLFTGATYLAAAVQLLYVVIVLGSSAYAPLSILAQTDAEFVRGARSVEGVIAWMDERLPPASRTLVLGVHESYGFSRSVRTGGNFDGPRIEAYLHRPSPAALHRQLLEDHFTHVALHLPTLLVEGAAAGGRRAESRTVLTAATAATLQALLRDHATPIAQTQNAAIFELAPARDGGPGE